MTERMLIWAQKQKEKIKQLTDDLNKLQKVKQGRMDEYEVEINIIGYMNKDDHRGKRKYQITKDTLNTSVSLDSLIEVLNNKCKYEISLFNNATESDFQLGCKWKISGDRTCMSDDCCGCSRVFDFSDYDKDKIVNRGIKL